MANFEPIYLAIGITNCKLTGYWVRTQAWMFAERWLRKRNKASASFTSVHWIYRSENPTMYSVTLPLWVHLARACLVLKA